MELNGRSDQQLPVIQDISDSALQLSVHFFQYLALGQSGLM